MSKGWALDLRMCSKSPPGTIKMSKSAREGLTSVYAAWALKIMPWAVSTVGVVAANTHSNAFVSVGGC